MMFSSLQDLSQAHLRFVFWSRSSLGAFCLLLDFSQMDEGIKPRYVHEWLEHSVESLW